MGLGLGQLRLAEVRLGLKFRRGQGGFGIWGLVEVRSGRVRDLGFGVVGLGFRVLGWIGWL